MTNDLTNAQRAAVAAAVDQVLMPLLRGVLVEKLSQIAGVMRDQLHEGSTQQPSVVDWGEVDGELMLIVSKYAGGASRGLQDELRTLLRKVSGQ